MSQKTKKNSPWVQCEKCSINIINKDVERHSNDCPPSEEALYNFIQNGTLFGNLDIKVNEDVKGIVDKDSLVFLSQSAIQLCSLSIGDWAILKYDDSPPISKVVWPTNEKTLTSVLLTKNAVELCKTQVGEKVRVSLAPQELPNAYRIGVVCLNGPKNLEIASEISNRLNKVHCGKLYCEGNCLTVMFFGKILKFVIKSIEVTPAEDLEEQLSRLNIEQTFYKCTHKTIWKLLSDVDELGEPPTEEPISKIGGLDGEIKELREAIDVCLKGGKTYGLRPCRSILLHGNSGTGKTLLARGVANESKAHVIEICASDLYSKYDTNVEETIKDLFKEALEYSPSIIILDEVDILCPTRSQRMTDSEKRTVCTLINTLDNLNMNADKRVFVLGTTNKLDSIDPVFRRNGRFDREIEICSPNPHNRKDILVKLLNGVEHALTQEDLSEISLNTHGFVGSDLVSLCARAGMNASRRSCDKISLEDFKLGLKHVRPSAMREVQVEVANVKWSDIGGQENLKLILKQAVEWPLRHPESFVRLGVTPPKGVLMFGPPGCSNTMIAKALATESACLVESTFHTQRFTRSL